MAPKTREQFEEMREKKQELIKATALNLFAEKGYYSASIREISRSANISQGLIYNYYESKEDLLVSIVSDMIALVSSLLDPNNDDEITNEEMKLFLDLLIKSLDEKKEYWMLFYQLAMQPEVLDLMLSKIENGVLLLDSHRLLNKYFEERFDDPQLEFLVFNSMVKGFCTIYLMSPNIVPEGMVAEFKERINKMFIREKKPR